MIYAKQMQNGAVAALLTYDFTPELEGDTVEITEEEYAALMDEMRAKRAAEAEARRAAALAAKKEQAEKKEEGAS